MTILTPEERGSFLHFDDEYSESPVTPEARLPLGWALMAANGSWQRSSTPRRPYIYTPIRRPNKGNLHHEIKRVFGSKSYFYHDTLSVAYLLLKHEAAKSKKEIFEITITLNDIANIELRTLDADLSNIATMVQRFSQWLRSYPELKDAIIVSEESLSASPVMINGQLLPRLHFHIVTILSEAQAQNLKKTLLRSRRYKSTGLHIRNTWICKWPYSVSEEIEEEQFGPIPQDKVDPNAAHWLNTYVKDVTYPNGKVVKMVHRVLPICLRYVDYLSKSLGTPIGSKGRNYAFRGLKGREALQIELAKQYAAVKREYA